MVNQNISTVPGVILIVIVLVTTLLFMQTYERLITYEYAPIKIQPRDSIKKASVTDEFEKKTDEVKGCFLYRLNGPDKKVIFRSQTCYMPIAYWNDFIIFPKGDGYKGENIELIAHSIVTGEEQQLFSLQDNRSDFEFRLPYQISQIVILNKRIYFSIGGHMTSGALYSISLPFEKEQPKLLYKQSAGIDFDGRRYWITGGSGDAGAGTQYRMIFDINSQKIGSEISTQQDLGVGTHYIGSDGKVAYLGEYHASQDSTGVEVKQVYSVDLKNIEIKKTILSKDSLPKGTKNVLYYEKSGEFLFNNGEITSYNLNTKKIRLIIKFTNKVGDGLELRNGHICLSETAELDMTHGEIVENREDCGWGMSHLKADIQNFHLPASYLFEEYP